MSLFAGFAVSTFLFYTIVPFLLQVHFYYLKRKRKKKITWGTIVK
jgi:hypothetical protein